MRHILLVAWNDLRISLRERSVLVNMFLISIVMVGVVGLANAAVAGSANSPNIYIDVIDRDTSALSAQFLDDLRASNEAFVLCPLDNDEEDRCDLNDATLDEALATERLTEKQSLALIVIPEGFEQAVKSGKDSEIIYRSNENASAPSYILQSVQAVTQRLSGALMAERVASDVVANTDADDSAESAFVEAVYSRAVVLWDENPVTVKYRLSAAPDEPQISSTQLGMGQSVPGMGSMYVMFAIFPALAALIRDREMWTLQRLLVTPATRGQVLAGKMLARFALGMMQYGVVFGLATLIGVKFGSDPVALILLMMGFSAAITALTLAIATLLRSEEQASGISIFLTLTLAPLGGAWWPLTIVPRFMQIIGYCTPVAWVMRGFRSLIYEGGSLATVLPSIAVLFGMAVVFYTLGALRFKAT